MKTIPIEAFGHCTEVVRTFDIPDPGAPAAGGVAIGLDAPITSVQAIEQRVLRGGGEAMSSDFIDARSGVRAPVEEAPVVVPSVRKSPTTGL
jgi:hypothetical protein